MSELKRKDILGLEEMSADEMELILDTAQSMREIIDRPIKQVPTLRGKGILSLFYESSTRTKISFDLAARYLSAGSVGVAKAGSSLDKGESLRDTVRNVEVMGPELVVMRHPSGGAPHYLAKNVDSSVINAGDGYHEHPTQGLLDMLSVRQKTGTLEGLKVAIIGDIFHSRVARSDIWGFGRMGSEVVVSAPTTLLPPNIEETGCRVEPRVEDALKDADVVCVLRLQLERQKQSFFPSVREYHALYGIDARRLALAKPGAILMHPGPMNRGVEITSDIADGPQSIILEQVPNGVAVRMALLYLLLGGGE